MTAVGALTRGHGRPRNGMIGSMLASAFRSVAPTVVGVGVLLGVWWIGGWIIESNPATRNFAGFAPGPTLARFVKLVSSGDVLRMTIPSLWRIGIGLLWAIGIGLPLGILIGSSKLMRATTNIPFQFLRMISPLAWMPIAVLAFSTWDGAIVFLVAIAAVWPVTFATANGLRKVDPAWFKVARNLGARPWHLLYVVVLPAIAQDVLTGVRLALGVAWIVIVPAEYLGVTSGLGYAINDARDTIEYDLLAAVVVVIGVIGFALDYTFMKMIEKYSWVRED